VLLVRAVVRHYQGRLAEALSISAEALELAAEAGDLGLQAQAHLQLEMNYEGLRLPERAEHEAAAMALLVELDDAVGLGNLLLNRGVGEFNRSDWTSAVQTFDRAAEEYLRGGDVVGAALARNNQAELLSYQFRLEEAGALFEDVRRQCRAAGYGHGVAIADSGLSRVAAWTGDLDRADALLAAALADFETIGMTEMVADTLLRRAELALLADDPGTALDLVRRSTELLADLPDAGPLPCVAARLEATCHSVVGDTGRAVGGFRHAVDFAQRAGFVYEQAVAEICLAQCDDASGDRTAAAFQILDQLGVLAPPPTTRLRRLGPHPR